MADEQAGLGKPEIGPGSVYGEVEIGQVVPIVNDPGLMSSRPVPEVVIDPGMRVGDDAVGYHEGQSLARVAYTPPGAGYPYGGDHLAAGQLA